jgi:multiple sugar transport system substrate-binding protein
MSDLYRSLGERKVYSLLSYLLAVVIPTLFFWGCSQSQIPNQVTLRFLDGPDIGNGWQEVILRFEKTHPQIKVELIEGPPDTDTREDMYSTSLLAQEGTYDLIYMDIIWVAKFAASHWIIPLDKYFPPEQRKAFLPGDIAGSIYQGKIYRVPMRSDAGVLYYRKDLLAQAGIAPPETWQDLVEIAQKLQHPPQIWGFVFQGKQYEGLVCNFLELLWGAGGELFDDQGQLTVDNTVAIETLQWMRDLIHQYKISPPGVTTYQEEESRHLFQQGKAIFLRNWPYVWSLAQKIDSPVRNKIGIIPMVHKKGYESAATLGGWGFGISSFTKNRQAAWEFIRFATSYQGQKIFHLRSGAIPTRHALFKDPEILNQNPHYSNLYRILLKARPRPAHPRYAAISDILQQHLSAALVDRDTPHEALKKASQQLRSLLN